MRVLKSLVTDKREQELHKYIVSILLVKQTKNSLHFTSVFPGSNIDSGKTIFETVKFVLQPKFAGNL